MDSSKPLLQVPTKRPSAPSPLRWLLNAPLALLAVVARRLWSHFGMMLALAAGFTVAITLVVAIPVYSEAVGYRVLKEELSRRSDGTRRPPFAFFYRYLGNAERMASWDDYKKLDSYMQSQTARQLGMPVQTQASYIATDKLQLLPSDGGGPALMWVQFGSATNIEDKIEVVDGRMPEFSESGPLEVLITEALANTAGFQVGDDYLVLGPKYDPTRLTRPVKIVGIWHPINSDDPYWFYVPSAFDDVFLMPEQSFHERIAIPDPKPIYVALWYFVTDGTSIRSENVPAVAGRIQATANQAGNLLPGARLEQSPLQALVQHQIQVRRLTVSLTIFSVPLFLLIGYFVLLVAGLVVQRQSNEIAVLRSRGSSISQVLVVYLLEALLLGLVTLGLGLLLGQLAALVMAWTRSFLVLSPGEMVPISLTAEAWNRAWQMLGLMMLASLLPALGAARFTIVSFRAERARATRPPFWQRAFLDFVLLGVVGYAYYLLTKSGPGVFGASDDPFANPLLLLAPTMGIAALSLVAVRVFPLVMRLCATVLGAMPGIAALTAFRSMARAPKLYTRPLLLLILTLSLATFTASMAATLDRNLIEQADYQTGGILRVTDFGQALSGNTPSIGQPGTGAAAPGQLKSAQYLFLPVSEYLSVPGVEAAVRAGRSQVMFDKAGKGGAATFLGIDRVDMPEVLRWRSDYANESLGALLNRIADDPSLVIVSTSMRAQGVSQGDTLTLRMSDLGEAREMTVRVAGFTNLFPTLYPEDGPFLIGDLDNAFEIQGGQYPYEVWLKVADGTTPEAVIDGLDTIGLRAFPLSYAPEIVATEQERPERQGVFGLLSVGFVAAALLTAVGFLFYALVMFQRRFVEMGALRAIGLSAGQLGALLAWEQGMLIACGLVGGTVIGIGISRLFIPFLQVRGGEHPLTPPFVVEIAWAQIGVIGLVFVGVLLLVTALTMLLLRRMRLFEAIKMGEAI